MDNHRVTVLLGWSAKLSEGPSPGRAGVFCKDRGRVRVRGLSLEPVVIRFSSSLFNSCWDTNDHSVPWWVIRTPILISIIVSHIRIET